MTYELAKKLKEAGFQVEKINKKMKKQTIEQRITKLEDEVGKISHQQNCSSAQGDKDPNGDEWITIDFSVAPKETFDFYGVKPFKIMKRKMRKDGGVWNNISWIDSKAEAEKLGLRLPHIKEMLFLLDLYKKQYPDNASIYHKEFLGVEELSYGESVDYEWVDGPSPVVRGAYWADGSNAGVFTLRLNWSAGNTSGTVGFRCAR